MDDERASEIAATFQRIRRPLQWPMENFRRRRVSNQGFVGYVFSRIRRNARAGFALGFALRENLVPGAGEPPEVVGYAFVEPTESTLHDRLVATKGSPIRRLVAASRSMGFPFEFHSADEAAAVRHRTLRRVPKEIFVLVASDFLMISFQPIRASGFLERVTKATTSPG